MIPTGAPSLDQIYDVETSSERNVLTAPRRFRVDEIAIDSADVLPYTMPTNPPTPQPKVIVLCFDGTASQFGVKVGGLDYPLP